MTDTNQVNWEPESLRLTVIDASLSSGNTPSIESLFGTPPTGIQLAGGNSEFTGAFGAGRGLITFRPGRIDVIWSSEDMLSDNTLGEAKSALLTFKKAVGGWLKSIPPISRFAIGGLFVIPAKDKAEAYKLLNNELHELNLDAKSSDFLYQINRPFVADAKPSPIASNCLAKWACRSKYSGAFEITATGPALLTEPSPTRVVASVELDLNTAPSADLKLDSESTSTLLDSFFERILGILTSGDRND